MKIEKCSYYIYHDDGYYNDADGKYDIVDNFGRHTLQWCINYLNRCRASGSYPKKPANITKIKRWLCGQWKWIDYGLSLFK